MGKTEQWKVIDNFASYKISNTGKVEKDGRILKGSDNGKGYLKIVLKQDGRQKKAYVHRLVATAFVPNQNNKPCVNHIDNNPSNNNADNLEWCTHSENMAWMKAQGRDKRTVEWLKRLHEAQTKDYVAVVGENIKTGEKLYFEKLNAVMDAGFQPSCVCNCCKGIRKQHKGYRWSKWKA